MKLLILSRPNSERTRMIEEFVHEFSRLHPGVNLKQLSLDTRDGAATAALYDIWDNPAIVAIKDDGSVMQIWQGEQLPLMNEVAAYAQ